MFWSRVADPELRPPPLEERRGGGRGDEALGTSKDAGYENPKSVSQVVVLFPDSAWSRVFRNPQKLVNMDSSWPSRHLQLTAAPVF